MADQTATVQMNIVIKASYPQLHPEANGSTSGAPSSLPPPTQDSLPVAGQALLDGLLTRKIPMKGFKVVSYISSPSPKLAWRKHIDRCTKLQFDNFNCSHAPHRAEVARWRLTSKHQEETRKKISSCSPSCCGGGGLRAPARVSERRFGA